jgi:hypothetical protein
LIANNTKKKKKEKEEEVFPLSKDHRIQNQTGYGGKTTLPMDQWNPPESWAPSGLAQW